jgi:hypothetical protein
MPFAFGTLTLFRPLRPARDDRRGAARRDDPIARSAGGADAGVSRQGRAQGKG